VKRVFLALLIVSLIFSGIGSLYGAETIKVGLIRERCEDGGR